MPASPWLIVPRPVADPRIRLFCFPSAGGAASAFHGWAEGLPGDVELCAVQLPGRANRLREAPLRDPLALQSALVRGLRPFLDRPFACFGHSLGASLSWEWTRRLHEAGRRMPEVLFLSGRKAPHLPLGTPPISELGDRAFIEAVIRLYDGPPVLLREPELWPLVLPALRADFAVVDTWRYLAGPPLPVELHLFAGKADPLTPRAELEAWAQHTTKPISVELLEGGHGYLETARAALLQRISARLDGGGS